MSKQISMKKIENGTMIASTEALEAIRNISDFGTVAEYYKKIVDAQQLVMCLRDNMDGDDYNELKDLCSSFTMFIDNLAPVMTKIEKEG